VAKKSIPSSLLAVVKKEDKERFRKLYFEDNYVLDVIKEAIKKELEALVVSQENEEEFSKPSWAERQACLIGERRALRRVLNLLTR
jgi:hypothetical protein